NGNIPLTAEQIGVSENTLYAWRRSIQVFFQQNPLPPQQPAALPAFENDLDALAFIRQNLITELSRLSASLQYDSGFSTPYQRALVLSQLMDKLLKLDVHLKPYMEEDDNSLLEELLAERGDADEEDEDIEIVVSDHVEEEDDGYWDGYGEADEYGRP